jgi:glycine C-acetyltransferase
MVDDSHAPASSAHSGRGTPERCGVLGRVDILTGTLGKALGGASGGLWRRGRDRSLAAPALAPIPLLQQHCRPSSPGVSLRVLDLLEAAALRDRLLANARIFAPA